MYNLNTISIYIVDTPENHFWYSHGFVNTHVRYKHNPSCTQFDAIDTFYHILK
jgi:hypothetical protein